MAACSSLFSNPVPWLAAIGSFLSFAYSSELGFLAIFFTSSAAIMYPLIVFCSRSCQQKLSNQEDSSTQDEDTTEEERRDSSVQEDSCENVEGNVAERVHEEASKEVEVSEKKEDRKGREVLLSSSETLSDSESFYHTTSSEDSENDWISRENLSHSTHFSDGSISDEESLIEIALPEGHFVESSKRKEYQQQPCNYGYQQKWPDCSMESHFRQLSWMEMLMEEENLIEIDIGMGSIKYSRFEIQA